MVREHFPKNGPEVTHVVPERHRGAVVDDKCLAGHSGVVHFFSGEDMGIGNIAHICPIKEIRVVSELDMS